MSQQNNIKKDWNPFGIEQWLAWIGATVVGVAGLTTFFYATFITKEAFAEYKTERLRFEVELSKRLERMEDKLDRALDLIIRKSED